MSRRFTDEQIAVANHVTGHALVSAVAGAGKTTTLVERCRRLIATGIPESQILCLQYNKDAQLDFSSRLTRRMGTSVIPHVKTYHAFCLAMWKQLEQQGHVGRTLQPKDSASAEDAMMRQALKDQAGKGVYVSQEQFEMLNSLKTLTKSCFDTPGTVLRSHRHAIRGPYVDCGCVYQVRE
ncbi:UvrD-helicase domain-containing protein [Xanthomonas perforans]|uniref:UvrD-helicase domain-containing protein n=1 Tax=Xanthomonas hortorum TaxID=56454 RepID=UPI001E3896A0|nr:UvrD-helicase domain-containing protein [Xanthomonas hortorum]MCC8506971.1 UvrD-helicase domain-containing protein [Xanthomonas hortorum pv. gardneri]